MAGERGRGRSRAGKAAGKGAGKAAAKPKGKAAGGGKHAGKAEGASGGGEGGLRRSLGLTSLSFYGIGLILGAGVYSILGAAAGEAGGGIWLAFLLGAGIALLTGLSYAELASMFPRAGAEYTYAAEAFPRRPWIAAATGYVLLAAGMATTATVAAGFGGYLGALAGTPGWLGALGILVLSSGIGILGMREAAWVNVVATLLEAGGLVLVIVLAWLDADLFGTVSLAPPTHLAAAGALVFFAYLGFEDLANLAEEAKRPERDVPLAILVSVAVTAALYALVGLAAVALAGAEALAASESPLADAAGKAGEGYGKALAVLAVAATANTVLITMVALSRMLLALARGGHAPRPAGRMLRARGTPWVATLVVLVGAAAFVPLGGVEALGSVASFATLLAFSVVNVVLVVLRVRRPDAKRPFRVPGAIGRVPVLPVLGVGGAAVFAASLGWMAALIGAGMVVAGVGAAFWWERRAGKTAGKAA